ncbi:hypothetical protein FQZ97_992230 [compost metagenome]
MISGPRYGKRSRSAFALSICMPRPKSWASCAYFAIRSSCDGVKPTRSWPFSKSSTSAANNSLNFSQVSRARLDSGSCSMGRPIRRVLPKLTPLACWPINPRSSRMTDIPRWRRKKAAEAPMMPPPTMTTSALFVLIPRPPEPPWTAA